MPDMHTSPNTKLHIMHRPPIIYSIVYVVIKLIFSIVIMGGSQTEAIAPVTVTPEKSINNNNLSLHNSRANKWGGPKPVMSEPFKGAIPDLSSKVFVSGPAQATK